MKELGPNEGMNALRHEDCRFCDEYERLIRGRAEENRQLKERLTKGLEQASTDDRREIAEAAVDMRQRSEGLRRIADHADVEAERLENILSGGPDRAVLRGRELVEALLEVIVPGEILHYREMGHRLAAAGFGAAGVDPAATLLTQINRAPQFERLGRRSGRYRRADGRGE